jgi:putative Holliday junction resolvase
MGVDYGEKRIGVAISDEEGMLAFPKTIISNDKKTIPFLLAILKEEKIENIVIGDSFNNKGIPNKIWNDVEKFISDLKKEIKVSVHKEKEFYTSIEARRFQGSKNKIDASAAALILQRYLDKINKNDKHR